MPTPATITHVVLTQWRPDATPAALAALAPLIDRFAAEIPGVVSAVYGPSVSPEGLEGEFEWGLVVTFADAEARDGYLPHPTHAPVAALIGRHAERVVVFDIGS